MAIRDSLKEATATAGLVAVALGPLIPANYVRKIYLVHTHNTFGGVNVITFQDAAPVIFDYWVHLALNDELWWPDGSLEEDMLPLYSVGGGLPGGGGVQTQVLASAGACWVRVLYEDVEGGQ